MLAWISDLPWEKISKVGGALFGFVVLLIVFVHVLLTMLENQGKQGEANTAIAVSNEKVAGSIKELADNIGDFSTQSDQIGDELRRMNNNSEHLSEQISDVLEHVRSQ